MLKLEEVVGELRLRTWSVDCPEMRLGRPRTPGLTEYVGPGYLRQAANGSIGYKLYPTPPPAFDPPSIFPDMVAGRILDEDYFHQLDAHDMEGRVWRVEQTIPSPHTSYLGERQFTVVSGEVNFLSTTRSQVQSVSSLKMMFFTEERVPGNASTEITTNTPDGSYIRSSRLDTAVFSTDLGNFSIFNRPGMLVVTVVSPEKFPAHFEMRIVETLSFLLAKPLAWDVLELVEDGLEIVHLRGAQRVDDAKLQPPISTGTIDMSGGDVWRLFDKYLTMVCAHTMPGFHPCSRHVFSVLEASAGTINSRGLALGVAVEGIAKDLFPDVAALPPKLKSVVGRLQTYFRDWPEFNDEETKKAIFARVEPMLNQILNVSAKSRLYALAQVEAVYPEQIKAWNKLRNATAHGVAQERDDLQQFCDLCDSVTVLMYTMIFYRIGYVGSYQYYSTHGWPKKYYRGRLPTEEETAVSAYYLWRKSGAQHGHDIENWFAAKVKIETRVY